MGLLLCVAGWTLYWLSVNLAGAIFGGCLGGGLAYIVAIYTIQNPTHSLYVALIGALIGVLIGIFFIRKLHRLFFFLVGAVIGFIVGWLCLEYTVENPNIAAWLDQRNLNFSAVGYRILAGTLVAFIGGILMVKGARWMVAFITACAGSVLLALAFPDPLALASIPIVAVISFFFQIGMLRRTSPPKKKIEIEEE